MPVAELKVFTRKEVAELGNGNDGRPVWLIYKNSVYDCTQFIHKHPGDPELILEYAGRDCTKDFDGAGHSLDAIKEMRTLKIGEITEDDRNQPKKILSQQSISSMVSTDSEKKRRRRFLLCR